MIDTIDVVCCIIGFVVGYSLFFFLVFVSSPNWIPGSALPNATIHTTKVHVTTLTAAKFQFKFWKEIIYSA